MLYINGEPFSGTIVEAKLFELVTESDEVVEIPDGLAEAIRALSTVPISSECMARICEEAMLTITGVRDAIIECCSNRRVVHLCMHAKKRKVRRKNLHRAIKILEETEDDYT